MRRWVPVAAASCLALGAAACGVNQARPGQADLRVITHGQEVDLAAHLAAGKYTVIDFYAAWCPPCRVVGPALERLAAAENGRLAVRKVDIVDWTMPVAEQYGIESLPHLMLYGPDGRRLADGDEVYGALLDLFGERARELAAAGEAAGAAAPQASPPAGAPGREGL
jgi:thioredoxin-like negative regulator of GroEL